MGSNASYFPPEGLMWETLGLPITCFSAVCRPRSSGNIIQVVLAHFKRHDGTRKAADNLKTLHLRFIMVLFLTLQTFTQPPSVERA